MPNGFDATEWAAKVLADDAKSRGVVVSWCRPAQVDGGFCDSITGLLLYDARTSRRIAGPGGGTISLQSSPRVAEARSQIVDHFLTNEAYKKSQWLLMLDADMTFEPDLLDRLLEHADPKHVPILGGLCFAGSPGGRQFPTIYRAFMDGEHVNIEPADDYPENELVKCGATGAACLLVHRQVYVAMLNRFRTLADGRNNPYPWFQEGLTTSAGYAMGEDVAFCRKAMLLGIPVHVHTGIKLGHMKTGPLTEDTFKAYRATQSAGEPVAV